MDHEKKLLCSSPKTEHRLVVLTMEAEEKYLKQVRSKKQQREYKRKISEKHTPNKV